MLANIVFSFPVDIISSYFSRFDVVNFKKKWLHNFDFPIKNTVLIIFHPCLDHQTKHNRHFQRRHRVKEHVIGNLYQVKAFSSFFRMEVPEKSSNELGTNFVKNVPYQHCII